MLGLGTRCNLEDACRTHGIKQTPTHRAATDTLAAAGLWNFYSKTLDELGLRTFRDLARFKSYKFVKSFECNPLSPPAAEILKSMGRFKSRSTTCESSARSGHKPLVTSMTT
jgi:hypothetical protein